LTCYELKMAIITALLWISVILFLAPVLAYFCRKRSKKIPMHGAGGISGLLLFSASLIGSVWCLRYAVGWYGIIHAEPTDASLNAFEEIFNSLVHALQTFSMDEDYTAYILDGKAMLRDIFGENTQWQTAYGAYATVLNFVAPVAGGAVVLEILASIFPKLRLSLSFLNAKREKLYFSHLDEKSLALAKSLYAEEPSGRKKPVIIFCNTPEDINGEWKTAAKQLGAVCVEEDLAHIKKNRRGSRRFFLMSENETENLWIITSLTDAYNRQFLEKTEICYFATGDAYIQVEKTLRDQLTELYGFRTSDLPIFIPIRSDRNLISNLLTQIPLYEPLVGKPKNADGTQNLTVTILGSGFFGTQMFLSTYWFGQMLNCNLNIRVISQETEEEFWSKIDYINPEIRHTTIEGDPILRINRKGDMAPAYAKVDYMQCDAKSSVLITKLADEKDPILKTDYFFVSLGSDDENISVANTIRKYVGAHRVTSKEWVRAVIAYVVYDPELSETLNRTNRHRFATDGVDVYMRAVGSLSELYSVKNVFMTQFELLAQKTHKNYASLQNRKAVAQAHQKRVKDDYKYWASLSRSMHVMYKLYSMGLVDYSVFDGDYTPEIYERKLLKAYNAYGALVCRRVDHTQYALPLHEMAWLEHRRWNAFTRVMGYRHTGDYAAYAPKCGYKQMDLKLHPCLVECDKKGMRAKVNEQGVIDPATAFQCTDCGDFDLLDELSYDLKAKGWNEYDFKLYDYPAYDV